MLNGIKQTSANMLNTVKQNSVKGLVNLANEKITNQAAYSRSTGAFNFGLLCATQSVYMMANKNIPDNSKKFLVSSEIFEGIMKISMFLLVANMFGKAGVSLVNKGVIVPKCVSEKLPNLTMKKAANIIKTIEKDKTSKDFKELTSFKKGMEVLSNVAGMIVGLSVVVPFARNNMAKSFREKFLNKNTKAPDNQTNGQKLSKNV